MLLTAIRHTLCFALLAATLLAGGRSFADEPARLSTDAPAESITHQQLTFGDRKLSFTVTAGSLPLTDAKGDRQAWMFFVAYSRDGAARETRPITFVFNGGPGASSAYLHIGALGPRIVDFGTEGRVPAAPAQLVDNPDNWLDLTDLVFVDPVGTGYSRTVAAGREAGKRYWGVDEDLQSLAAFIDLYLNRTGRAASPKYLVGESYGGFRAARLPHLLAMERGIGISGAFLISPVLEFSLLSGDEFMPLPHVLRLPSYAAVALERRNALTPAALVEAERFALGPYLTALVASPRDEVAMRSVYAAVAHHTGLPEAIVAQHDARVPLSVFTKEVRRTDKLVISRYAGSVTGPDAHPASSGARGGDPILDASRTVLTGAMVDYLGGTLGVHTDLRYYLLNSEVERQWDWRSGLSRFDPYVSAGDALREELARAPSFRLVVAHGMTDLLTPYMTSRYVIDHLPPLLTRDRVSLNLYPGGHMMYLRSASRALLHADAAKLYPVPPL
jgi:carboxypeptidase C (cathepsin A)